VIKLTVADPCVRLSACEVAIMLTDAAVAIVAGAVNKPFESMDPRAELLTLQVTFEFEDPVTVALKLRVWPGPSVTVAGDTDT